MLKRSLIVIMLFVLIVISFSSCSLVKKDPQVDKLTTIIEVLGDKISKEETGAAINNETMIQNYYFQYQNGYSLDLKSKEVISQIQDIALNKLVREKVISKKISELSLDILSDEKLNELNAKANESFAKNIGEVKTTYFKDTDLKDSELEKAITTKYEELGYPSLEDTISNDKQEFINNLLREFVVKGITVTDDEIKNDYDIKVEQAKSNYQSNPSAYGSDVLNNQTIYYIPAGYRYVKQILIKFTEDDINALKELNTSISEKNDQIKNINDTLANLDAEKEENKEQINSLNASLDEYNNELKALKDNLAKKMEEAYKKIGPKLTEVTAKLDAGTDFDMLIEEYGEDPGMKNSPTKEIGYPVCKAYSNFDQAFTKAAMELHNINDVSPATKGIYGYYIIKYFSDAVEGAVPIDSLKEQIKNTLLTSKQDEAFEAQISTWITEANAKIFKDRLN